MCFGGRDDPEVKKSRDLDRLIKEDEKTMARQVKLLLLGKLALLSGFSHLPITPIAIAIGSRNGLITLRYRRRREWEVNNPQADAPDLHQGGFQ